MCLVSPFIIELKVMKTSSGDYPLISQLEKAQRQIAFMLKQRQKLLKQAQDNPCQQLSERYISGVDRHLQQYDNRSNLVQLINDYESQRSRVGDTSTFWSQNMIIEKDVEENLRRLKEMDNEIDRIINQEADFCSSQEEIQASIRKILTAKQANYLSKAEPFLLRKNECAETLSSLREQKMLIKEQKLALIKKLLEKLEKLKQHREKRVLYCRDRKLTGETISMLKLLLADFNEVLSQRKLSQQNEIAIKRLTKSVDACSEKIDKAGQELLSCFSDQQQILAEISELHSQTLQSNYFEAQLLSRVAINSSDLMGFMDRSATFVREEEEKKKELEQILQAVSTTSETIKIFKHIHEAMESQSKRRGELLKRLESLQAEQEWQSATEDKIAELEGQLQKVDGKRQRLLRKMSSKVNQADLAAYKTIHQQLLSIETECRVKQIIINDMKSELSQKLRQFLVEAASVSEDYADITSEVVPEAWIKQLDFQEDTISEIKAYLGKMLSRLNI